MQDVEEEFSNKIDILKKNPIEILEMKNLSNQITSSVKPRENFMRHNLLQKLRCSMTFI